MSSTAIHIADYAKAVAEGVIPGAMAPDRLVFEFPEVTSVNTRGATLHWRVRVHLEDAEGARVPFAAEYLAPGAKTPAGVRGVLTRESYQVNAEGVRGKTRAGGKPTVVARGKSIGRKNETNPATQALRNALSAYGAQKRRGDGARAAKSKAVPAKTPPPMLVKRIGETRGATLTPKTFEAGVVVQRKYNGVRAPSFRGEDDVVIFYSRQMCEYPGLEKLRKCVAALLEARPPVPPELAGGEDYRRHPVYLDGELYLHGRPLNDISGLARNDEDSDELCYMVYDCFWPTAKAAGHDMPSRGRQAYLDLVFAAGGAASGACGVERAKNFAAASLADVFALRDRFLAEGYEGAIVRKDGAGYRYGINNYHSDHLVKVKPIFDSEFAVVGYTEGKGKDRGAVIWECRVDPAHVVDPADVLFRVVPKDVTNARRKLIFQKLGERPDGPDGPTLFEKHFRGRPLKVEYPERSKKTGKPTQAKALGFRADEPGAVDPLSLIE